MERRARWLGRGGVAASLLLWGMSLPALRLGLLALDDGGGRWRATAGSRGAGHGAMWVTGWLVIFVGLQLASPVVLAFTLRAIYRLRMAMCVAVSTGWAIALDAAALLAVLIWLRLTLGAG